MKLIFNLFLFTIVFINSRSQSLCIQLDCKTSIQLPRNTYILHSKITTSDSLKKIQWNQIQGNKVNIDSPTSLYTKVSTLSEGTYIFSMTAITNKSTSTVYDTVIVLPINKIPIAIIQPISPITLPINTFTLDGSKSIDSDGIIKNYNWSTGDTTPKVNITAGAAGVYNYTLTVTDDQGAKNTTSTSVIVNPAIILPPSVSISGSNIVLGSIDTLIANAFDPNPGGSIKQYGWGKISGPGSQTIIGANTSKAIITGLQPGQYTFKVTVWNVDGLINSAAITFLVAPSSRTITKIIIYYSDGTSITIP